MPRPRTTYVRRHQAQDLLDAVADLVEDNPQFQDYEVTTRFTPRGEDQTRFQAKLRYSWKKWARNRLTRTIHAIKDFFSNAA